MNFSGYYRHIELKPGASYLSALTRSVTLSMSASKSSSDLRRLILVYLLLASFKTPGRVLIFAFSMASWQSSSSSLSHFTHA